MSKKQKGQRHYEHHLECNVVLAWRLCRLPTHGDRQRGQRKLNKYQEALNSIGATFHDATVTKDGGDLSKYFEIKGTLQELVDRATPMKPIVTITFKVKRDSEWEEYHVYGCPNCKLSIETYECKLPKHCHNCGQAFDGSDK